MMDIVDKGISGRDKSLEKDGRVYEDSSGGTRKEKRSHQSTVAVRPPNGDDYLLPISERDRQI